MTQSTILVADDEEKIRKFYTVLLGNEGYEVILANDGVEALEKAANRHIDLIILDVMMPKLDGYSTCLRLRENPVTEQIPILMATSHAVIDRKIQGFEAGADDYITKPFAIEELLARVKALLVRSQRTMPQFNIFISYRRDDSAYIATFIYNALVHRFGKEAVFKDVNTMPFGKDFRRNLDATLQECSVMLVLMGSRWLNMKDSKRKRRLDQPDDVVRLEIETAINRHIPAIPLLVEGVSMPKYAELPPSIADFSYHNALEIRPHEDFDADVEKLIYQLEHYMPASLRKNKR